MSSDGGFFITEWLRDVLTNLGLSDGLVTLIVTVLGVVILATVILLVAIVLVWLERKLAARIQDRVGPNRVGPFGLLQPVADIVKLILKEDITPEGADRTIFNFAPILVTGSVLLLWAVIPFAPQIIGADLNVGVLYIVAIGGLGTLGIIMAGWSSNNKYALLGAFRSVAQLISYEVPLILVLLVPVILSRSMGMNSIVAAQDVWFVVYSPLAAIIFLVASIAEIGRTPFDLLEAESEIVAGYHIEYSGMKFGLFLAAELIHALLIAALTATLFLGGWRGPFVESVPYLGVLWFILKTAVIYFIIVWVRGTLPRVRIDHMLDFNWKMLVPLALILLAVTAVADKLVEGSGLAVRVGAHLGISIVIILAAVQILRSVSMRTRREKVAEPMPFAEPPPPAPEPDPAPAPEPAAPPAS
ncbi:MAG: NADH-quinone oxidoreductase subunit NuoH [Anaerolineales bacterium]|nr:NADH-quinone oxidoreductase subunit NuoH [Anaerolineales bacterium]